MKQVFAFFAALCMFTNAVMADESTISLSGQGVVQAEPDEGYIAVGVVSVAENSAQAVKDNSSTMSKLYLVLKEQGVTRNNIQTVQFSINENWKQVDRDRRERDGFQVVNMVRITVCELDTFGKVLDALVTNGANQIQGISFGSSKASELRDQARVLAVKDAMRRAELLIQPLGLKLGKVMQVSESSNYGGSRVYAAAAVSDSFETPVSGGTLSFSASVSVSWELQKSDTPE